MKIYLIRHGESESDVKQKYDGDYDDHLTEKGLQEAENVANKLLDKKIEIIFSSSKIRARETSKIINEKIDCPIEYLDDLGEQDIYGAYPNLSKDQPEEEYRRLGEVLANKDEVIEGVESYQDFKKRIIRIFEIILNSNNNIIAIITHGGPIRCIFREVLELGEIRSIGNGAIIEIKKNNQGFSIIGLDNAILK